MKRISVGRVVSCSCNGDTTVVTYRVETPDGQVYQFTSRELEGGATLGNRVAFLPGPEGKAIEVIHLDSEPFQFPRYYDDWSAAAWRRRFRFVVISKGQKFGPYDSSIRASQIARMLEGEIIELDAR